MWFPARGALYWKLEEEKIRAINNLGLGGIGSLVKKKVSDSG